MVESDRRWRRRAGPLLLLLLLGGLSLIGCAGGRSEPQTLPPESPDAAVADSPQAPPAASEPPAAAAVTPEAEPPEPQPESQAAGEEAAADESVVLIESGEPEPDRRPVTLAEAARAERERRRVAPPTQIVITDKNLDQYAVGQLTVAESAAADSSSAAAAPAAEARGEAYWRGRAREIREAWRAAADRVEQLESEIGELRQRFYAEDDGFYRDSQIKPAWDRAIDRLEATRQEALDRRQELAEFLEEGRQAGALPGWLREGIELEPIADKPAEAIHEPGEPEVYRQYEDGDPP